MNLLLEQSAKNHSAIPTGLNYDKFSSFKAGAEWQKEQYKRVLELLNGIAGWAGNLPDERLQTKTGPNDAAMRGGLICDMRSIAIEAIQIMEPEYKLELIQD